VNECDPKLGAGGLLVIGYGNTLRRDDGVGPRVAEAVAARNLPGVSTLACHQLTPELADPISRAQTVVFVDAAAHATPPPKLARLTPADAVQLMAHASSPEYLLALARVLFGHAPTAWMLALPAEDFAFGEELSAQAQSGMAQALAEIVRLAEDGRMRGS
jgi:hydrogenase maturation protease